MKNTSFDKSLEGVRHLLSHLHTEIASLETQYQTMIQTLQALEVRTERDELTGLLRRQAFSDQWQSLMEQSSRNHLNHVVLMIDLDHFKNMNDTHGHLTGDEVLRKVAEVLRSFESPECLVGRFGGEEFVVAVQASDAEGKYLAEMIRQRVERLSGAVVGSDGKPSSATFWKCTLSIGMASSKNLGFDASRMLQSADQALYQAKAKGRNQVA
jgi:diguanylate cyclase (GGDEF)-like protein